MTDGIFLINKQKLVTSNSTLSLFKERTKINKAGILGILDPHATGILPIVTGQALKYIQFIQTNKKGYCVECKLGQSSVSGDLETDLVQYTDEKLVIENLNIQTVKDTFKNFLGKYMQVPPMYSSTKFKGKPLYKYARKNIHIHREHKERYIYSLEFKSLEKGLLKFNTLCSSGTYIRTLVEDLATKWNLHACLTNLDRFLVEPFEDYHAVSIDEINLNNLDETKISIDKMLRKFTSVELKNKDIDNIYMGRPVEKPSNLSNDELVRLYNEKNIFCGIGHYLDGQISPKRLMKR